MATRELPDPELLRKLLSYDSATGFLTWKLRPRDLFPNDWQWRRWNTRHAGKPALTADKGDGYLGGSVMCVRCKTHRVVWALHYGKWPEADIDHINGNRSDNRIENLRDVSRAENCKNQGIPKNNTSGIIGVHWYRKFQCWRADIKANGRKRHLGYFATKEDAAKARKQAEEKYGYHSNHGRSS